MKKIIQLFQWLFGAKINNQLINQASISSSVNTVLSKQQIYNALVFYDKHKAHIDKLVSNDTKGYEPSQSEDKNNPIIWKSEYWKWFLQNVQR